VGRPPIRDRRAHDLRALLTYGNSKAGYRHQQTGYIPGGVEPRPAISSTPPIIDGTDNGRSKPVHRWVKRSRPMGRRAQPLPLERLPYSHGPTCLKKFEGSGFWDRQRRIRFNATAVSVRGGHVPVAQGHTRSNESGGSSNQQLNFAHPRPPASIKLDEYSGLSRGTLSRFDQPLLGMPSGTFSKESL